MAGRGRGLHERNMFVQMEVTCARPDALGQDYEFLVEAEFYAFQMDIIRVVRILF